jgi:hypothetical protein
MIDIHFMGDNIGSFRGFKTIDGKTYVKYMSGWGDVKTIPLEVVSLGKCPVDICS